MNDIDTLKHILNINTQLAEDLLLITHWVDQQIAIRRFGYPKDNSFPVPMDQRLQDPEYLTLLLETIEDMEQPESDLYRILCAYIAKRVTPRHIPT